MSDRHSLLYFTLSAVYAIFLMIILLLPSDSLPVHKVFSPDKIWHIGTYFILALCLIFSFREAHYQIWFTRRWTLIIALVHGGLSELLQGLSQGRTSDLAVYIAHCIGIGLALLLLYVFPQFFE